MHGYEEKLRKLSSVADVHSLVCTDWSWLAVCGWLAECGCVWLSVAVCGCVWLSVAVCG